MENHDLLHVVYRTKDIGALRSAVANNKEPTAAPLLAKLLLEDWHDSHEDIVFELGLIGDSCAVDAIAKAIITPWPYLIDWDLLHDFQRKCAYALARIGTSESKKVLENLSKNSNEYLRKCGEEGLQKWPIPYKYKKYLSPNSTL